MSFFDVFNKKPQVENISLQRIIPRMKKYKIDTVYVTTSRNCPLCKQYNRKKYSFYGWNKHYQKFPEFLYQRKCPQCSCCIGVTIDVLSSK